MMAAGRKCRQHDKSPPNYIWNYRKTQKLTPQRWGPAPLPNRQALVIYTGYKSPLVGAARGTDGWLDGCRRVSKTGSSLNDQRNITLNIYTLKYTSFLNGSVILSAV